MIKLFRNIRKALLEKGKTTNYLKYAIGEIVLVVIGILIALQINNWNESRKAVTLEDNFFKNVLIDLQKDKEKLTYYKKFHSKRIECLDTLLIYVRNPYKQMGINKFGMYAEPLFYSANPTTYNTTFESAKTLGDFNNFKSKAIIKDISQYYADFVLIEYTINSILRFIENQFEPLMYTLPESYMTEETGNLVINEEEITAFYKKIASIKDYRNLNVDYTTILKTPSFENYLIGDMGRTYNALGKIEARLRMIQDLNKKIKERD